MLAATAQREIRPSNGNLRHLGTRLPLPVFRAAYKELCTRIWIELELLAQALAQVDSGPPQDLALSSAILRLELVVLIDSCRSPPVGAACYPQTNAIARLLPAPSSKRAPSCAARVRAPTQVITYQGVTATGATSNGQTAGSPLTSRPNQPR